MADERSNPFEELGEWNLRSQILATLAELSQSPLLGDYKLGADEFLEDYTYSTESRGHALEPKILEFLDQVDRRLFYKMPTAQVEQLKGIVSSATEAINAQRARRAELSELSRIVVVEISSKLIEDLRMEADEMKLNTLGVVPEPVAAVLKALEAAAKDQTVDTLKHFMESRRDSVYSAIAEERGHTEENEMADITDSIQDGDLPHFDHTQDPARTADFGDEEKIPLLEGMIVRRRASQDGEDEFNFPVPEGFLWAVHQLDGEVVELDGITHPGIGTSVELQNFWRTFTLASDVVQPGPVMAAIGKLAREERSDRASQILDELGSTLSTGASKVAESAAKLNERYGPVGERIFKKAVSAAKSAVAARVQETTPSDTADSKVLSDAFSDGAFEGASEREIDLQALREKLASTAKVRSTESKVWDAPRDQLAQLIYDAQHPDQGSKWLTTVDGSPNIVSYEAADAVLERFPDLFASSGDGAESDAENSSEHSSENSEDVAGEQESENIGPKLEDFPLPVPPAESDLDRLRYLQRSLSLDDFESSNSRDDAQAELLELLPNTFAEIAYLRDNEGEIQQGFALTLEKLRNSVDTSSVRQAWVAYEEAIESRDRIYESRQDERAKVRQLEARIAELEGKLDEAATDRRTAAEKIAGWTEEANRRENAAINRSSVNSYNRWAESQRELPLNAGKISYLSADTQRELGHVSSFMVSGIPMAVKISEQEGTTLKLLELIPQGSENPLFRKEICATGFLTEEKLRKIVTDSDGWLGNDAVEAAAQPNSSSAEGNSPSDESATERSEG